MATDWTDRELATLAALAETFVRGGAPRRARLTTIGAPPALRERWRREHGIDELADGEAWTADVAALERELAVSEVAHPPPKDEAILRGAERLGWEAAPIRRDSLGCDDCGSCPFGCRRGSKRSGIPGPSRRCVPRGRPDRAARPGDAGAARGRPGSRRGWGRDPAGPRNG